MNFVADHDVLHVTGLDCLSAMNCADFKQQLQPHLTGHCRIVELDCSTIRFIDSDGLGVLINLHRQLAAQSGGVRMLQPSPMVRHLLGLLHLDNVFEVIP